MKKTMSRILIFCVCVMLAGCAGVKLDETTVVQPQIPRENTTGYNFPVGYEKFHEDPSINFFLNRLHSYGYGRKQDMIKAGAQITDFASVVPVMYDLADEAEADGRRLNAAMYLRAVEFYTPWGAPEKLAVYERFLEQFYLAIEGDPYVLGNVEYERGSIATMMVPSGLDTTKGTIIIHAGYDGFKEELYPAMKYLASHGYDVIGFDVPWMGRSNEASYESFSYEWENVIGTVLDFYEIKDVTLVGISFGGWLALRAAALEPRISRVVASSVSFDVNQYASPFGQAVARFAMKRMNNFVNTQIVKEMEKNSYTNWFYGHLMHITSKEKPVEAAMVLSLINEDNLHSDLITQDVMIQTGIDDHLIPFKMHGMQVEALVNARSVKPLVFTEEVSGQNHCQIGNFGLALDLILDWLDDLQA